MKKLIITIITLLLSLTTWANPITKEKALQIATTFLNAKSAADDPRIIDSDTYCAQGNVFYVFNAEDQKGFVVVSGDDRAPAILAYSLEGRLHFEDLTCSVKSILEDYAIQIRQLRRNEVSVVELPQKSKVIPMLMKSTWGQRKPYNDKCALFDQKAPTGCIATAMAQLLFYHHTNSTDKTLATIPGYTCRTNWTLDNEEVRRLKTENVPAGTVIDWNHIKNHYTMEDTDQEACSAISSIMRYCGISVEMEYKQEISSASFTSIPVAMRKYFGYSSDARIINSTTMTPREWQQMICDELSNSRPVILSGETMCNTGHVFICDGIDNESRFHINWGWNGQDDGYFLLTRFTHKNKDSQTSFCDNLHAITGLHPAHDEEPFVETIRLTTVGLSIGGLIQKQFVEAKRPLKLERKNIKFKVPFCYQITQRNLTASTYNFESALGVFDKKGRFVQIVEHTEESFHSFNKTLTKINSYLTEFGASLKKGVYQLWPLSRREGTSEWLRNEDYLDGTYIQATVKKKEISFSMAKIVKKKEKKKKK